MPTKSFDKESIKASIIGKLQRYNGRTITVQIKDKSFKVISRQKTLPVPTCLTRQIFREALGILGGCWSPDAPIRLLSVTASGHCPADEAASAQLSFLTEVQADHPRQVKLEQAVDAMRSRFGRTAIQPGTVIHNED